MAVEKSRGRQKGEEMVRIAPIRIVNTRAESLKRSMPKMFNVKDSRKCRQAILSIIFARPTAVAHLRQKLIASLSNSFELAALSSAPGQKASFFADSIGSVGSFNSLIHRKLTMD